MRRILQISFFVFYIASTYAVSQERTTLIVSKLQRASQQAQTQFDAGGAQGEQDLPNYRHAKPKTTGLPPLVASGLLISLPPAPEQSVHLPPYPVGSLSVRLSILSRAPPVGL